MVEKTRPMKEEDGYEYSEDFDGSITSNDTKWLFNLKMICDNGGAQTRSLREVYHFIATQLDHLLLFPKIVHALFPKNLELIPANVPKSTHNFGLNFSE